MWLGAYGAESKKPIKIFAPVNWIVKLKKPIVKGQKFENMCTSVDGKHTGNSKALKQSQHYPQAFGKTVADEFLARDEPPTIAPSKDATGKFTKKHDWTMARLDTVHLWLDRKLSELLP